jgi:hypothetical protein
MDLVRRAATSLSTDAPDFDALWEAVRLARDQALDLGPIRDALDDHRCDWALEDEERVILYGLLAEDSAILGTTRDATPSPIPEWGLLPEHSDPVIGKVMQSALRSADDSVRFINRVLDKQNRYFAFAPAWEVEPILPKVFGSDDPAVVIAQHMRTLFDVQRMVDEPAGIFLEMAPATDTVSSILTLLIAKALSASDLSPSEKTVLTFLHEFRQNRWAPVGVDRAQRILTLVGASLQTDQRLFVTFLNTLIGHAVDFHCAVGQAEQHTQVSNVLYKAAVQLLFIYGGPGIDEDSPVLEKEPLAGADPAIGVGEIVAAFDALLEKLEALEGERPHLPSQLLPHLLQLEGVFEEIDTADNASVFMWHIRAGVKYRANTLRGYAQYELDFGYLLQSALQSHRLEEEREDDLTYQLGQLWLGYSHPDDAVLTSLPLWLGYGEYSTADAENRRSREYAVLLRSAISEGFLALADAIAAFFLFSQSLRYRGRLEPWDVVAEIVSSARALADSHHTQLALSFVREMASHYGEQLLLLRIGDGGRSSQKYDYAGIAGNIPGIGFAHRDTVAKEVIEEIGEHRRRKLTPEGFDLLVGAHYKLSKLQRELIFGVLRDWGGIATEFTRVFEVELTRALGGAVRSDEYRQFKKARGQAKYVQGPPTLGSFLHLLREYAELPMSLQGQLQAASELHGRPQLLDHIDRLISEHRNPAAHGGYDRQKLQELLKLLYTDKVLMDFIDALRPHEPREDHR